MAGANDKDSSSALLLIGRCDDRLEAESLVDTHRSVLLQYYDKCASSLHFPPDIHLGLDRKHYLPLK